MKRYLSILLVLFLLSCTSSKQIDSDSQHITLETSDGYKINALYTPGSENKSIILLHQLGSDLSQYDDFIEIAKIYGFHTLAIDFRGHGKSQGDWRSFNDSDFVNMEKDVFAAIDHLKSIGIGNISIVGTSIGANTAINVGFKSPDIKSVVAISPSYNYRGIDTNDAADQFNKPLLVVTATGDSQSYDDSVSIYESALSDKQLEVFDNSEHGKALLDSALINKILGWLI